MNYSVMDSPLGPVLVAGDENGLRRIVFLDSEETVRLEPEWIADDGPLRPALDQLTRYFDGGLKTFDLPLSPIGTAFQRRVWELLRDIPYGATESYGQLARRLGRPTAARAVGAANASNPLPIVIPCHRVVGGDGALTGYRGGLRFKKALLELEGKSG